MEVVPYRQTDSLHFPLPLYHSVCIGEATRNGVGRFFIFAGLDQERVAELKALSLDEGDTELQKNTADRIRFGTNSYEDWYAKERTPFMLVDNKTKALSALAWFGPKPLGQKSGRYAPSQSSAGKIPLRSVENWHTISYRCYPHFRGKGLMKSFVTFVMKIYTQHMPRVRIWAGINTENAASEKLAKDLGFTPMEEISDRKNKWLVMIKI